MVKHAELPAGPLLDGSLGDDPLAPEPVLEGGILIGYARVSTGAQRLDRQTAALKAAGCARVYADKASGKDAERAELWAALEYARPGDTLVVPSLDRLGRSLQDLISIVAGLRKRGIGFRSLHEAIDTTTPGGRLVFHVFAALAEFIRELIVQGTNEGLAAARARGQRLGRPPALTPDQVRQARALLARPEESISSIARLLGISRSTLYKYVPEAKGRPRAVQLTADDVVNVAEIGPPVDRRGVVPEPEPLPELVAEIVTGGGETGPGGAQDAGVAGEGQDVEGQDDAAGRRREEERRWRRALKPIGADVAGAEGYRGALWPDEWGRYHVAAPGGDRLGYVEKERTGWEARDTGSHLIDHRLRTRARAVAALVRRHRERTPLSDAPVDGLPDGWRLTQTLAEHDDGQWRLIASGGEIAGTISRASYGGRRAEWRATTGDPGRATAYRATVLPDADDPARGSDSDLWRTRAGAVRALAAWCDPELELAP